MKRPPRSINWPALKAEFVAGGESLNGFRLRHGLARDYFYKRAKGWDLARGKLRELGVKKSEDSTVKFYARFADETRFILEGLLKHARQLLEHAEEVNMTLAPAESLALAKSVSEALRAAHLLEGKPTDSLEVGPPRPQGDLNAKLVDLLEAMDESDRALMNGSTERN